MAVNEITLSTFRALRRVPSLLPEGVSPGCAARQLGVSRQAIHLAIHRGDLDATRITDENGKLLAMLVTEASLQAFADLRELRSGSGRLNRK